MKHFHHLNHFLLLLFLPSIILITIPLNASNRNTIEIQKTIAEGIDLELNFETDSAEYSIFTNHSFTLTLSNRGEDTATGIAVYAPFPSSLSYTDSEVSQGDYSVFSSIWNIDSLAIGESATLDLTLFVLNVDIDISLFAQVQAANEIDIDSTPNNNTSQIPIEDDEAIVTITRLGGGGNNGGNDEVDIELNLSTNHTEVNAGLQFSYILTATNDGEDKATGVRVYFPLPLQVKYIGSNSDQTTYNPETGEWNIGNIPSKLTRSVLIDVEVLVGGTISATAEVIATNEKDVDSTPNNGAVDEDDLQSVDILGLQIDLELNMELPSGESQLVEKGKEVTFLVHVENKGPTVGYNSKIRAIFPEGFTYVRNEVTLGEYVDDLGVWVIGDIPPFETQTMEVTATVDAEGPLTYTCEARTSNVPDIDSTPSNNDPNEDDIDSLTIYTNESHILSDIELTASIDNEIPYPEDSISITLLLTNYGPAKASNIVVEDVLPSELSLIEAKSSRGMYVDGSWSIEALDNGETATLILQMRVEDFAESITYFAQVASIENIDNDSNPANNVTQIPQEDDEASVTIFPTAVGIEADSFLAEYEFNLFPTPTHDIVNLSYLTPSSEVIDIVLYDFSGRKLYQKTFKTTLGTNVNELDLSQFPVGVYLVSMETEKGILRGKAVKK